MKKILTIVVALIAAITTITPLSFAREESPANHPVAYQIARFADAQPGRKSYINDANESEAAAFNRANAWMRKNASRIEVISVRTTCLDRGTNIGTLFTVVVFYREITQ